MSLSRVQKIVISGLALACCAAGALACGVPTTPPPPPPAPPIVCCKIVAWHRDPICPGRQVLILCYFREDGLPLYQSNPMPLASGQQCACGLSPLPAFPGVADDGLSFGSAANPDQDCMTFPPNVPGYGHFTPECNPQTNQQVDSFFDVFTRIAEIPPLTGPCPRLSSVFSFSGPGQIPPGQTFRVYRKVVIPAGFNPAALCPPGGLSAVGLFLVDNGQVLAEPPALGLPPVGLSQFFQNPGASAFYKVKCLPLTIPAPCPLPGCRGDSNGDGIVNFADITSVLSNWALQCPF